MMKPKSAVTAAPTLARVWPRDPIDEEGTQNPLLVDEIDKTRPPDYRGDSAAALLEVDPEQNFSFNDHYLEVDHIFVLFINTTANSLNMLPSFAGPHGDHPVTPEDE
ncbi:MAG: hypothetical protein R3C27_12260 [Hyphomonadaceae bacterium]